MQLRWATSVRSDRSVKKVHTASIYVPICQHRDAHRSVYNEEGAKDSQHPLPSAPSRPCSEKYEYC